MNDKKEIMDGTKTWTGSKLENSTLFKVPKENNITMTKNQSSAETSPSIPIVRPTNVNMNNNNEQINATIIENTDTTNNRSRYLLPSDGLNSMVPPPLNSSTSNDIYQRPKRKKRRKKILSHDYQNVLQ